MSGKLIIRCELEVLTGMHIGGTDIFSAIGAVDSPVIRDSHSGLPIVPGSSLKGKLRALLAHERGTGTPESYKKLRLPNAALFELKSLV